VILKSGWPIRPVAVSSEELAVAGVHAERSRPCIEMAGRGKELEPAEWVEDDLAGLY